MRELAALKQREAQAQRLADRDGLTGLYNRRRMLELLDSAIVEATQLWQCVGSAVHRSEWLQGRQ